MKLEVENALHLCLLLFFAFLLLWFFFLFFKTLSLNFSFLITFFVVVGVASEKVLIVVSWFINNFYISPFPLLKNFKIRVSLIVYTLGNIFGRLLWTFKSFLMQVNCFFLFLLSLVFFSLLTILFLFFIIVCFLVSFFPRHIIFCCSWFLFDVVKLSLQLQGKLIFCPSLSFVVSFGVYLIVNFTW